MEQALGTYYTPKGILRGTYALVRYADDLAVLCPTQEKAIEAREILSQWLGIRGLKLSDEKTHIRHLREGFNFLAFNIRHYPAPNSSRSGYKLLIKPSPEAVKEVKRKLKGICSGPHYSQRGTANKANSGPLYVQISELSGPDYLQRGPH